MNFEAYICIIYTNVYIIQIYIYMPQNSLKDRLVRYYYIKTNCSFFYKSLLLIEENQVVIFLDFMNNKDHIAK